MGVEMLRGVYTERSECAQHDSAVTHTDSWMNLLNFIIGPRWIFGTAPLTGERAQATFRGRPRGRLGRVGSGKGCLRGRPRGRFGSV